MRTGATAMLTSLLALTLAASGCQGGATADSDGATRVGSVTVADGKAADGNQSDADTSGSSKAGDSKVQDSTNGSGQVEAGQQDEKHRTVKERLFQLDDLQRVTISVREHKFKVWVMDDHQKRQEGMMFLQDSDVKADEGMIFVFPDVQYRRFWMKNTLIPLDIAYLNLDGKIINTYTMRALDTTTDYGSNGGAIYVVELKAGTFAKKGIRPGDKFVIPQEVVSKD